MWPGEATRRGLYWDQLILVSGSHRAYWRSIGLAPPLINHLTLDKALYLSMPQFPHLQNRTPVDFKWDVTVNINRMTQSKHSCQPLLLVVLLWLKVVLFFFFPGGFYCILLVGKAVYVLLFLCQG